MQLKYQIHFQRVGTDYVGIGVGEDAAKFSGMIQVNEIGYDIISCLTHDTTLDTIVTTLSATYEGDSALLRSYVENVLNYLRSQDLLLE